jgi:SAM-dependent MidA family methyltransferase
LDNDDTALRQQIFQAIRENPVQSIGFAEFMGLCLYHPLHGYYADPATRRIGRTGDFFTSVSVGDTFGRLLGHAIETRLDPPFHIVEQGAHDGRLALDIVRGLNERHPAAAINYTIFEPDPIRQKSLEIRLAAEKEAHLIRVVDAAPAAPEPCGIFLCNELLDALPFSRVRCENGTWLERRVGFDARETLTWISAPIGPLAAEVAGIDSSGLPDGYTTEVFPIYDPWMASARRWFGDRGLWWIIDYGHEEDDFYAPARNDGTLRAYRDHRQIDDPFSALGRTDLTADVNFSRLDRAAAACGLRRSEFTDQHHFLIRAAAPWLRSIETGGIEALAKNRPRLRQFQTLTHPGLMGRTFKVAEYAPMP